MSDASLQSLYQQVILDHSKQRHGAGIIEGSVSSSHQLNPTCGDEITLHVYEGADGVIEAIHWDGQGCSISTASASILSDLIDQTPQHNATEKINAFREMMHSRGSIDGDEDLLEDAVAFQGASRYVARVKCAMLPWVALEDAIAKIPARG